ncbi:unnamed protein product [Chondrus crispus]|uniref:Uncharacterized protein n=1 Tax=Chondrus crispus TaxID=2769 RepID=R7Q7N4_CHOCR|nr:unnamed protein product [Chondrus crispus]CDF33848.1 unnamed protein product [Chondrus crispus]|eukprot:XP_005713667.1 unnamed protein product [Chondrus crispus]
MSTLGHEVTFSFRKCDTRNCPRSGMHKNVRGTLSQRLMRGPIRSIWNTQNKKKTKVGKPFPKA